MKSIMNDNCSAYIAGGRISGVWEEGPGTEDDFRSFVL